MNWWEKFLFEIKEGTKKLFCRFFPLRQMLIAHNYLSQLDTLHSLFSIIILSPNDNMTGSKSIIASCAVDKQEKGKKNKNKLSSPCMLLMRCTFLYSFHVLYRFCLLSWDLWSALVHYRACIKLLSGILNFHTQSINQAMAAL